MKDKAASRAKWIKYGIFFAVLFIGLTVLDILLPSYNMLITVLKKGTVYALLAVSMNILNGFTGLFSLGQAGFMLLGAYTYGVLTMTDAAREIVYYLDGCAVHVTLPWWLGLILAGVVAAVFAFLIGLPVLKLKSDYLAIATLGFAEILRAFSQWDKLSRITNGSIQLRSYPTINDLIPNMSLTPYVIIVAFCMLLIVLMIDSTYGRAFKAIRDDEIAAEAMGINLAKHKMISFITSSFFAGVGGALLAMYQTAITAAQFKSALTYEILLIVVIGGIGSITGSVLASFLYVACSEWWLRGLDEGTFLGISLPGVFRGGFRMVVFSVIIMIIVLFFRKGIMGERELDLDRVGHFFAKTLPHFIVKDIPHFFGTVLPGLFKKKKKDEAGKEETGK